MSHDEPMASRARGAAAASVDKVAKKIAGTQGCTVKMYAEQRDGEVDWDTVGEMGVRHLSKEVESVSAVDFKFGDGKRGGSHPSNEWRYVHEKHDIMVFKKSVKGSPLTIFMGRGVIEAPFRKVAEFLKNVDNNLTWDNLLVEAKYVKVLSESDDHVDYIGYQRFESTNCFVQTQRDMLYFVRCLYKDGNYIQAGVSVDDPEYAIPEGLKRVEVYMGSGWFVEPYKGSSNSTLVTYIGNTDLKGIPYVMMNQVLKRHPLALRYIRYQLTEAPHHVSIDSDDEMEATIRQSSYESERESSSTSQRYSDSLPIHHFLRRKSSEKN